MSCLVCKKREEEVVLRDMYAAWSSFKENMNCSQLRVTAVFRPEMVKDRKDGDGKVNRKREITCVKREYHASDENVWQNSGPGRFLELETGDISRNVVKIIFHTTSIWKQVRKIERILKVTNLPEVLEKFEDYREMVKKHARSNSKRHPRSLVDGNELLRFYVTTMSCCTSNANKMTELCCNAACGVCRIIQPLFRADNAQINETRLCASSNRHCKGTGRRREVKKAVVLCRVIAGTLADVADTAEGSKMGLFDSHGCEGLSVMNPHGILPCFVIIYA